MDDTQEPLKPEPRNADADNAFTGTALDGHYLTGTYADGQFTPVAPAKSARQPRQLPPLAAVNITQMIHDFSEKRR